MNTRLNTIFCALKGKAEAHVAIWPSKKNEHVLLMLNFPTDINKDNFVVFLTDDWEST
jgi:hypothetical protein